MLTNTEKLLKAQENWFIYLFFFNVLCFSANSTIFSLTWRPLRRRTAFMCFRATFSLSAFSPKCKYSSSVVGTQNGSISITYNEYGSSFKWSNVTLTDVYSCSNLEIIYWLYFSSILLSSSIHHQLHVCSSQAGYYRRKIENLAQTHTQSHTVLTATF